MAGVSALISSLLNLGAKLLPEVKKTFFAPSSLSSAQSPDARVVEADLKRLIRRLERIKATLHDAEERNIRDKSVQHWLKELRELAHDAEYVLDEYMYEVYRAQVEARNASQLNAIKGEPEVYGVYSVQIPEGMVDRIREIASRFEDISKDREALCLREEDAPRRRDNERRDTPTSHFVVENSVFGREEEKEQVIKLLFSDHQGEVFSVLPIVGKGGLGKTTVAQLIYNDKRVRDSFDMLGWVYVSDDFCIERITRDIIECFTRSGCNLNNLDILQETLAEIIKGKSVFLVLDDVWNEKRDLWELLRRPLMEARMASILVTTRNTSVADIMQTKVPLLLAYLSDDKCWLLFTHYAFQGTCSADQTCFVEIGKKIVKKCGGLPLAIKAIASLLSHETKQQSWKEILQSDMWELDAGNEILAPLQISYERMPMYLKPCLLLCSMFPKDYKYDLFLMSRLWVAHGYIEPKGRKTIEEVAAEYAEELLERSFFDDFNVVHDSWDYSSIGASFRLHDMVHDLAWINSEKICYSGERCERPISRQVRHFYLNSGLRDMTNFLTSASISVLETLVIRPLESALDTERRTCFFGEHLRALDLELFEYGLSVSLENLKHLHYLSFRDWFQRITPQSLFSCYNLRILILNHVRHIWLEGIGNLINLEILHLNLYVSKNKLPEAKLPEAKLPESLGFLRKLRVLEIRHGEFAELPESIGNLVELHRIVIEGCPLQKLPESLCKLTNMKQLILINCRYLTELPEDLGNLTSLQYLHLAGIPYSLHYLSESCAKLIHCTMNIRRLYTQPDSSHGAVGWLKDFNDLKGVLKIQGINHITNLTDAQNANFISKHNIETLHLVWTSDYWPEDYSEEKGILELSIGHSKTYERFNVQYLHILECFQPHPNLKHLYIDSYGSPVFPRWMGDPLSCASLIKLCIRDCFRISSLPLGNLFSLKHLLIDNCRKLVHLKRESLPSRLENLTIWKCPSLVEVALLEALVELHIRNCHMLKSLSTIDRQMWETASESSELEVIGSDCRHFNPPEELKIFPSLKKMTMAECPNLFIGANQLLLAQDCEVHIFNCCNLKEWCLQHNFNYEVSDEGHRQTYEGSTSGNASSADDEHDYLDGAIAEFYDNDVADEDIGAIQLPMDQGSCSSGNANSAHNIFASAAESGEDFSGANRASKYSEIASSAYNIFVGVDVQGFPGAIKDVLPDDTGNAQSNNYDEYGFLGDAEEPHYDDDEDKQCDDNGQYDESFSGANGESNCSGIASSAHNIFAIADDEYFTGEDGSSSTDGTDDYYTCDDQLTSS